MKQFKTILAAFVLMVTLGLSNAQAQDKIAHIASQELIEAMPGYKKAMRELEQLEQTYKTDLQGMLKELETTYKGIQEKAQTLSESQLEAEALRFQEQEKKVEDYRRSAAEDVQNKRVELLKPVYEKARETVLRVAREKGFTYVLDSTTGTGVILADGYDLMADVKKALGI